MEHTIFGLIKTGGEIAGQHKIAQNTADAIKLDLDAMNRALFLYGCEDDPKPERNDPSKEDKALH